MPHRWDVPVREKVVEVTDEYILTEKQINGDNIARKKYTPTTEVVPDSVIAQVKELQKVENSLVVEEQVSDPLTDFGLTT